MDIKKERPIEIKKKYFEKLENDIRNILNKFHSELFYEEYDYMYDTSAEAEARANGKNPMDKKYVNETQKKRKDLGVTPLNNNGTPSDYSTEIYIHNLVFTFLEELKDKTKISKNKTKGNMKDFLKNH